MAMAIPIPPPMQSDATPFLPPVLSNAYNKVTSTRVPANKNIYNCAWLCFCSRICVLHSFLKFKYTTLKKICILLSVTISTGFIAFCCWKFGEWVVSLLLVQYFSFLIWFLILLIFNSSYSSLEMEREVNWNL